MPCGRQCKRGTPLAVSFLFIVSSPVISLGSEENVSSRSIISQTMPDTPSQETDAPGSMKNTPIGQFVESNAQRFAHGEDVVSLPTTKASTLPTDDKNRSLSAVGVGSEPQRFVSIVNKTTSGGKGALNGINKGPKKKKPITNDNTKCQEKFTFVTLSNQTIIETRVKSAHLQDAKKSGITKIVHHGAVPMSGQAYRAKHSQDFTRDSSSVEGFTVGLDFPQTSTHIASGKVTLPSGKTSAKLLFWFDTGRFENRTLLVRINRSKAETMAETTLSLKDITNTEKADAKDKTVSFLDTTTNSNAETIAKTLLSLNGSNHSTTNKFGVDLQFQYETTNISNKTLAEDLLYSNTSYSTTDDILDTELLHSSGTEMRSSIGTWTEDIQSLNTPTTTTITEILGAELKEPLNKTYIYVGTPTPLLSPTSKESYVLNDDGQNDLSQSRSSQNASGFLSHGGGSVSIRLIDSFDSGTTSEGTKKAHSTKSSYSCNQRCGEDASYPCSCDEKCVVHKTCCRDMSEACPGLYSNALTNFEHLLSASVRCDAGTVVLMVQSCPAPAAGDVGEVRTDDKIVRNPNKNQTNNMSTITTILSNAPVTDYKTGIIYANASIYNCNKRMEIFSVIQTSVGLAGSWKTQIGTRHHSMTMCDFHMHSSPDCTLGILNYIESELDISTYSYTPPQSHPVTSKSLCYNQETLSCIANLTSFLGIQDTIICNSSVSDYYKIRKDLRSDIEYDERLHPIVCDVCLSKQQNVPGSSDRFFLSGFRVLMSLSETTGQVVYDLHEELRGRRQAMPWWSWTCDVTENASPIDPSCKVLQCDPRFHLTKDGLCGKVVEAEFSIQDQFVYNERVCKLNVEEFARVTKCLLKTFANLVSTEKPYRTYQAYNWLIGSNLTAIRMEMYFNMSANGYEKVLMSLVEKFDLLYAAILIFAQNECSLKKLRDEKTPSANITSITPMSDGEAAAGFTKITKMDDIPFLVEKLTVNQMLEHFKFAMCLQTTYNDADLEDAIICDHRNEHMVIYNSLGIKGAFSKAKQLECVRAGDVQPKSLGLGICSSLFLFGFSAVLSALVLVA
ncbi:hypothetical protein ElyMa_005038200 [Elysia marginata]|uniref:SMB domain-containing protein n=1 Tax=Elysia marginata TaxID=1093978 RepID=A0AAV4JBJ7_9GAST|nr:hypothetical protein ElyMa_005038200 [Elysia marginata]